MSVHAPWVLNSVGAAKPRMLDNHFSLHNQVTSLTFLSSTISPFRKTQSLRSHENHNPRCHAKIWQGQLIKQQQKGGIKKYIIKFKRQLCYELVREQKLPPFFIRVTESRHQEGPIKPIWHIRHTLCVESAHSSFIHVSSSLQSPCQSPLTIFSYLRAWLSCRASFVSQALERCEVWQPSKFGKN